MPKGSGPGWRYELATRWSESNPLRQRCIVVAVDPDTGAQDLGVFRRIRDQFGNAIAVNGWAIRPGTIHIGDTVCLLPTTERPDHIGG